jgi:hypothetical protein
MISGSAAHKVVATITILSGLVLKLIGNSDKLLSKSRLLRCLHRPNFNAYMVAGARAISTVASMAGNSTLAQTWSSYASGLYQRMEDLLYSDELNFWIDVVEGTNLLCQGRELKGYYPYRFGVGTNTTQLQGLEAAIEKFLTEYGPPTLETTSPYYTALKNTTYCCQWNGQSWPFSSKSTPPSSHRLSDAMR